MSNLRRYDEIPKGHRCECSDPGCPVHKGISRCDLRAAVILHRADMEDISGTAFCDECADDAGDSGLFWIKEGD